MARRMVGSFLDTLEEQLCFEYDDGDIEVKSCPYASNASNEEDRHGTEYDIFAAKGCGHWCAMFMELDDRFILCNGRNILKERNEAR